MYQLRLSWLAYEGPPLSRLSALLFRRICGHSCRRTSSFSSAQRPFCADARDPAISMSENVTSSSSSDPRVRLAYERTYLAFERTQMAWVRTALSFISFGFAIAKFFEWIREQHPPKEPLLTPRIIGLLMITSGLVALLLSELQHRRALKVIRKECPNLPPSLAGATGAFIAVLGILALLAVLLRE